MKVLFAISNEEISESIVKRYQAEYKQIISSKNVYYFNAILKEIQKDKSYDRIVISEELEEFTSSSYEQRDKFIFEKLDEISDEALNAQQDNISIILICSERRSKSDDILVKFFGIGIYNAIIGNDRSIDQVCKLINLPRSKKQAKIYYNIETDEVKYKPESENDVNEDEMRNILNHFKKLGKNEEKYVQSFNNIVTQYNEKQLKIIISMLPLNVRAVLEESSPEYQKIATSGGLMSKKASSIKKLKGPSEKLLMTEGLNRTARPVVVPATMGSSNVKKVVTNNIKPAEVSYKEEFDDYDDDEEFEEIDKFDEKEKGNYKIVEESIKEEDKPRKRGRPRKQKNDDDNKNIEEKPRKRGRPKKVIEEDTISSDELMPNVENGSQENNDLHQDYESDDYGLLPGLDDVQQSNNDESDFNTDQYQNATQGNDYEDNTIDEDDIQGMLPGFEISEEPEEEDLYKVSQEKNQNINIYRQNNYQHQKNEYSAEDESNYDENFDKPEFDSLLTPEKKVVAFLGTTKNGTSFIVNSVAEVLSKLGVNVAILDATKNKNSYYIYTKNSEELRKTAINSFQNLILGNPYGVQANQNLSVYTGIPVETENIKNYGPILKTLVKNHTCVLIDCDYNTPKGYFDNAQELFLVQSMDILTIQPLTAFLRELKSKNILDEKKINIVINKCLKLKGITSKNIIGGMAFYNDPEMSFMTELFDRNNVKYTEVPFNEEVYTKYLSGIVECEISSNNYPKDFKNILTDLAGKVYPLAPRQAINSNKKGKNKMDSSYNINGFSSNMNNTLNNMRKNY